MLTKSIKNSAWKCVFLAAVAAAATALAPPALGQTVILPSSPAFEALPSALSTPRAVSASAGLGAIRITEPSYVPSVRPVAIRNDHSRRTWLLLSAISSGAATFDAYTTRQAIGRGAVELDPTMKPFANSNALYAAIQASPVVLDLVAYKMQRSENRAFRRMWWLPQSVGTAMSLSAGFHNLGYAPHP